jgi:hypothetical protein
VLAVQLRVTLVALSALAVTPVGVVGVGVFGVVTLAALDWADTFGVLALSKASMV